MNITLPETPWNPQPPVKPAHQGGITEVFKTKVIRPKASREEVGDDFERHNEDDLREAFLKTVEPQRKPPAQTKQYKSSFLFEGNMTELRQRVSEHLEEFYGKSLNTIIEPDRTPHTVAARREAVRVFTIAGLSAAEIGRQIERDHSTILNMQRQLRDRKLLPKKAR